MSSATGIVMDDGCKNALADLLGSGTVWNGAKLRLFSNNVTPANTDVIGTYTEATFAGYASGALTWGTVSVSAHVASSVATTVTFSLSSGSQNIYGPYITNAAGTILLAAARDANAPVALNTTTNTYQVTVTLSLKDQAT
jgi:hypothetical protein